MFQQPEQESSAKYADDQVDKMSINVTTNSPSQDYNQPDDHTSPTQGMTSGSNPLQIQFLKIF